MFGRTGSIQLARIFGIRIGVDVSWFVVLFFFIFILSGSFRTTLDSSDTVAYVTAVASALLFFASLVLHELGHALVARRLGIEILGIDLWFFGGIAKMSRDTETPGAEFKVAVAGPLVTLVVVAVCVGIGTAAAGWNTFLDAATLRHNPDVTPALVLLGWLASINAFVFVFNLIPAFPMDGGRIARAIAWRVTGDRLRATRVAAGLGQAFSVLLICGGLFQIIALGSLWPLWYVVLGLFLGQAARGAVMQTVFAERLGGVKVEDIMDREPVAAPADIAAERALDEFFLRYRWSWFPVVDAAHHFVGIIRQEPVDGAVHGGDAGRTVGELMDADDGDWRIGSEASLEALLGSEPLRRHGALMAVDPGGVLRGVVTIDQVRRALQSAVTPEAPAS
jgi:Zn-dependent protease